MNVTIALDSSRYGLITITGLRQSVTKAQEELSKMKNLFRTKIFIGTTGKKFFFDFTEIEPIVLDAIWTTINDSHRVIQYQLQLHHILSVCEQQTSPIAIVVHHLDRRHELGVDEQVIETVCRNQLIVSTCKPVTFGNEWIAVKNDVLQRTDYGKDICLREQSQNIILYGLPHVVKDIQQRFELVNKTETNLLNIRLFVARTESIKPEEPRRSDLKNALKRPAPTKEQPAVEPVRSTSIQGQKSQPAMEPVRSAPMQEQKSQPAVEPVRSAPMQEQKSQPAVEPKPPMRSMIFDIDQPGFEVLISQDFSRLLAVVASKCSLEKEILHHSIRISIPKAKARNVSNSFSSVQSEENASHAGSQSDATPSKPNSNWFTRFFQKKEQKLVKPSSSPPEAAFTSTTASAVRVNDTVDAPKIMVRIGDLKTQAVKFLHSLLNNLSV